MAGKRSGPKKGTRTGGAGSGKRSRASKKDIDKQNPDAEPVEPPPTKARKKATTQTKGAAGSKAKAKPKPKKRRKATTKATKIASTADEATVLTASAPTVETLAASADATVLTDVAPPPQADIDPSEQDTSTLGVDLAILWHGDLLTAQFFPRIKRVSFGPNGTYVLPEEVVGRKQAIVIEPDRAAGACLRIDHEKLEGNIIVDGKVHSLAAIRGGEVEGLRGPTIPLTEKTRGVLSFGEFSLVIRRVRVPVTRSFGLWSKDLLPLLLSFLMALLVTIVPIGASFSFADLRSNARLSYVERLDKELARLEYIEVELPEEKKEEEKKEEEDKKEEEKKEEQPALTPAEVKKDQRKVDAEAKVLQEKLKDLSAEERQQKIKALVEEKVDETTADLDKVMADMSNQMLGTRLFQEIDGETGETLKSDEQDQPADILADPEGLTVGKELVGDPTRSADHLGEKEATKKAKIDGLGKDTKVTKTVDIAIKNRKQKLVRVGGGRGAKMRGELPKRIIKRYISTKMGAIKACYQKGLQSNPGLRGRVKVAFLIQPTGKVAGARVKSSGLNSPAVEACILRNIKTWRFPRAKGGGSTRITYPFHFKRR